MCRTPVCRCRCGRRRRRCSAAARSRAVRRIVSASMPHAPATASGAKPAARSLGLVQPRRDLRQRPRRGKSLVEERVDEREQEERVRPGPDEQVLVGHLGCPAAARVDHDHAAAALLDRAQPARACRALSAGCRSTPAGWRPASAGSRCGRRLGSGSRSTSRTSARRRRAWASGRRSRRRRCSSSRAPSSAPARRRSHPCCARSGCPGRSPTASRPCSARIGVRRRSISANASSHETSLNPSGVRTSGRRMRSGSSCNECTAVAFGQRKPWLKTSCSSPRSAVTWSPSIVSSSPQVASQSGQVR